MEEPLPPDSEIWALKRKIIAQLREIVDPASLEHPTDDEDWPKELYDHVHRLMRQADVAREFSCGASAFRQRLIGLAWPREILDEVLGLGPLEPLLYTPGVDAVVVEGPGRILVIRGAEVASSSGTFEDEAHVSACVGKLARRIGKEWPTVDLPIHGVLADGSEVLIERRVPGFLQRLFARSPEIRHRITLKLPRVDLKLIGYWLDEDSTEVTWPHPRFLLGEWPGDDRAQVLAYLSSAPEVVHYRGPSTCRFCRVSNGSSERSDGTWIWPAGLPHYVEAHSVVLPKAFIECARRNDYRAGPVALRIRRLAADCTDLNFWKQHTREAVELTRQE